MSGEENGRAPRDRAVALYLSRCAGKSPVFLARRFLRDLRAFAEDLEALDDEEYEAYSFDAMPVRQAAVMKLVATVANERVAFLEEEPAVQEVAAEAFADTARALELVASGERPRLRSYYREDEPVPTLDLVYVLLQGVSEGEKIT